MSAEDERAASPRGNGEDAPRGAGELGWEGMLLLLAAHFGDSPALCLTTPSTSWTFSLCRGWCLVSLRGGSLAVLPDGDTCAGAVLLTAHLILKAAVLLPNSLVPKAASGSPAEQEPSLALGDIPAGLQGVAGDEVGE